MNGDANITHYGREVVIRSSLIFCPFHCLLFEVRDVSSGEPYMPIAVFYAVEGILHGSV